MKNYGIESKNWFSPLSLRDQVRWKGILGARFLIWHHHHPPSPSSVWVGWVHRVHTTSANMCRSKHPNNNSIKVEWVWTVETSQSSSVEPFEDVAVSHHIISFHHDPWKQWRGTFWIWSERRNRSDLIWFIGRTVLLVNITIKDTLPLLLLRFLEIRTASDWWIFHGFPFAFLFFIAEDLNDEERGVVPRDVTRTHAHADLTAVTLPMRRGSTKRRRWDWVLKVKTPLRERQKCLKRG